MLFHSLKKLLQKPTECYRKPSEIMLWPEAKLFYGTYASRTDELLSTTMSVLDDHLQAQHRRTLQKFARLSLKIVVELSTMFVK
jgi:hypothetical protein